MEGSAWGSPIRRAAWNQRPGGHRLGAGPTIRSTIQCSDRAVDLSFVRAAASGDANAVRSILEQRRVTEIDVRVRPVQGQVVRGRPVTALHAASAAGAADVVALLLQHGASPTARMQWLRALTPLHVAKTPAVATMLLEAGAPPIALDPREPEPCWYHRQNERADVARAIAAWRRAREVEMPSPSRRPATAAGLLTTPRRVAVPSVSAAEVRPRAARTPGARCQALPTRP